MFNRIYIGIFLSVALALASSYALYSLSYTERKASYQSEALSGSLQLILESLQTQPQEQQQAYLDIISRLFGAEFTELHSEQINSLPFKLQQGSPVAVSTDSPVQWLLPVSENRILSFQITEITEQQFRAHALLFVAELSRNNAQKNIQQLQQYSNFPLALTQLRTLDLDAQQRSRLRRGSVVVNYDSDRYSTFSVYAPAPDDQVIVFGPVKQFDPLPVQTALMMVAATILVIVAVSGWLVFRMDRRLQIVTSALQRFGEGETATRVELSGHDHISALGDRINDMSDRISKLLQSQRYMMQAVSHELRTPLARVRFRLEMLETEISSLSDAQGKGADTSKIDGVRRDLDQLEELIDEVLEHYRLAQVPELDFQAMNPAVLIKQISDDVAILFPDKSIELQLQDCTNVLIHQRSFRKLIQNLISNACKHAVSQILVSAEITTTGYLIKIEDDGVGISAKDKTKIFEAFYRADTQLNQTKAGYGLGLAIASRIAELHRAEIELETSRLGGACFMVTLPFKTEGNQGSVKP